MSKSDKLQYLAIVIFMPFVISAGLEFLAAWISVPLAIVGGIFWFGTLFLLGDKNDKE